MELDTLDKAIAFITARIFVQLDGTQRSSIGTGFLYLAKLNDGSERTLTLLISNKHVFLDPHGTITISLNKKKADGTPDYGNTIDFVQKDFQEVYVPHPDAGIDLACINASQITHTDAFYKTLNDQFLNTPNYENINTGSSALFVGYPENRYDVVNNLPLIRKGSIASLPAVDFNGKGQIVIDAQVFQGSSGSPVFTANNGHYLLLGVVTETMIRHAQLQTLPANFPQVGVQQILGLGIIIKQRHVKELIDHAVADFTARNPA